MLTRGDRQAGAHEAARHFAVHAGILYHLDSLLTPDAGPTWQVCILAIPELYQR